MVGDKVEQGYSDFLGLFRFNPNLALMVGLEREAFLANKVTGKIEPIVEKVLKFLKGPSQRFTYDLPLCQLEDRVGPVPLPNLEFELKRNEADIILAEEALDFKRLYVEVGPLDTPTDVYPDERYLSIVEKISYEKLLAGCRVVGTHVHIGMPDFETAVRVYNGVIDKLTYLCELGDHSNGERLSIYKTMAQDFIPPHYENFYSFYEYAKKAGFEKDPRSCWHLIRISVHGTIEFRMFGVTPDLQEVVSWASVCHDLCKRSM